MLLPSCWLVQEFVGHSGRGLGTGDDQFSWAWDGGRVVLWHKGSASWGRRWGAGDILGMAVDMDERKLYW